VRGWVLASAASVLGSLAGSGRLAAGVHKVAAAGRIVVPGCSFPVLSSYIYKIHDTGSCEFRRYLLSITE
jgi:hypothetical protein